MLRVWAASHQGYVRSHNEDYHATSAQDADASTSSFSHLIDPQTGWVLVADGMGGHAAGEIASLLAVKCLALLMVDVTAEQSVHDCVNATNLALHEAVQQQPRLEGMGTTIAGVRFVGYTAICFNVGDSRIYVRQNGHLRQVSADHVVDGHYLTQCLGGSAGGQVDPSESVVPIGQATRLLLCTDGLSDLVSDDQINIHLASENPAEELVAAALAAGGIDNVTAVVVESV